MKKFISSLAAVALLAVTVAGPVSAAGIAIDSAVYDDTADQITVTDADKDYTADPIATWALTTSAGASVASGDSTEVTEADGSFVIETAALDGLAADTYTLVFTTVANDFSVAIVTVGNDNQVTVTALVEPVISFSLGENSVDLGTLDVNSASSAFHQFTASSNGSSGYNITVVGATLTDSVTGATIDPIGGTATASNAAETEQFGINLVANTAPTVGANPSGGGGVAEAPFSSSNLFAFQAGTPNLIASAATNATGVTTYTVSYIANISSDTESGSYSTTLTYSLTPTF